jgi:hypothetical protein
VYRSVEWYVEWGLAQRILEGLKAIGIDEIHWGTGQRGANFLTVIYQIDAGCRRLLWVGPKRTQASLRRGLKALGPEVVSGLRFVCSDMWKPYLQVIAAQVGQALHVLDRFHSVMHQNQAVDQVRRAENARLRGAASGQYLKKMRAAAARQPRARPRARVAARAGVQQAGHRPSLGIKGSLSALLEIYIAGLGEGVPALLVYANDAQPVGTDEESGAHAPSPRAPAAELVSRERRALQRRGRRLEQ